MTIIDIAGSVVSGVLSGGATGLLGVLLQQWGDHRRRGQEIEMLRLQHAQAIELRRLDQEQQLRIASLDAASAERLAEIDAMARADESAASDYRASLQADRATYLDPAAQQASRAARLAMATVDLLRGIIRPGATIYSLCLLTLLLMWVLDIWQRSGAAITQAQQMQITSEVIGTVTYLAVTCTVWWFGVRPAARK